MNLILEGKRIQAAIRIKEAQSSGDSDDGSSSDGKGSTLGGIWDTISNAYEENPWLGTATGAALGSAVLPWWMNATFGGRGRNYGGLGTSMAGGLLGGALTDYMRGSGPMYDWYQQMFGAEQGGTAKGSTNGTKGQGGGKKSPTERQINPRETGLRGNA